MPWPYSQRSASRRKKKKCCNHLEIFFLLQKRGREARWRCLEKYPGICHPTVHGDVRKGSDLAPREGWSLDQSWSSKTSINSVLKIRFLLNIFFNDPFSLSSAFYKDFPHSDPSQKELSAKICLYFLAKQNLVETRTQRGKRMDWWVLQDGEIL